MEYYEPLSDVELDLMESTGARLANAAREIRALRKELEAFARVRKYMPKELVTE